MIPGIPPHLMFPVLILFFLIWLMLVHHFRRNSSIQKFVAETIGDDTPETDLQAFEAARQKLSQHLQNRALEATLRKRIETALGIPPLAE